MCWRPWGPGQSKYYLIIWGSRASTMFAINCNFDSKRSFLSRIAPELSDGWLHVLPGGISKLPFEVASHKKFKNPRWTYFYFFARRSRLLRRLFAMIPLKFVRPFPRKYSRSFFCPSSLNAVVGAAQKTSAIRRSAFYVPSILPRVMWQTRCNGRGWNSRCLRPFPS